MPEKDVSQRALYERLIFGYDGTNYRVVKVDTSGNLVAALAAGSTIEVTQDDQTQLLATAYLAANQNVQARNYGYIGSAWQKNPLRIGYGGVAGGRMLNTNLSAGYNLIADTACPANRVYVVTLVTASYTGTVPTMISVRPVGLAGTPYLIFQLAPVSATRYNWSGQCIIEAGDYLQVEVTGATAGDDLQCDWGGYYFDVNL